jgi:hypothetical protein
MSEYEDQANKFMADHGIKFHSKLIGDKCPIWCDGKHMHGDRYLVTFTRLHIKASHAPRYDCEPRKRFTLSFWNSRHDQETGEAPTAYDVLYAIEKNDPRTFEDFCGEFGYDTDSRKAETTYKLVKREWAKVSAFFTESELTELYEIN